MHHESLLMPRVAQASPKRQRDALSNTEVVGGHAHPSTVWVSEIERELRLRFDRLAPSLKSNTHQLSFHRAHPDRHKLTAPLRDDRLLIISPLEHKHDPVKLVPDRITLLLTNRTPTEDLLVKATKRLEVACPEREVMKGSHYRSAGMSARRRFG